MITGIYNPDCKATCPKCGYTDCLLENGFLAGDYSSYIDLYHQKCGTKWRHYVYKNQTIITEQANEISLPENKR